MPRLARLVLRRHALDMRRAVLPPAHAASVVARGRGIVAVAAAVCVCVGGGTLVRSRGICGDTRRTLGQDPPRARAVAARTV